MASTLCTVFFAGGEDLALRGYNASAEEEADWLAAALLLPREALVHLRSRRVSDLEACELYGVSNQMLAFRMRVTGVERQFSRRKTLATRQ